jgi:hypothetical protein
MRYARAATHSDELVLGRGVIDANMVLARVPFCHGKIPPSRRICVACII